MTTPQDVAVTYTGTDDPFKDRIYRSGLTFAPGQTRMVPATLAQRFLRHSDVFKEGAAGEAKKAKQAQAEQDDEAEHGATLGPRAQPVGQAALGHRLHQARSLLRREQAGLAGHPPAIVDEPGHPDRGHVHDVEPVLGQRRLEHPGEIFVVLDDEHVDATGPLVERGTDGEDQVLLGHRPRIHFDRHLGIFGEAPAAAHARDELVELRRCQERGGSSAEGHLPHETGAADQSKGVRHFI